MSRPVKTINEIVRGKTSILPDTALQLETVLKVPASFWLKRQNDYDEFLARQRQEDEIRGFHEWCKGFPIREIRKQLGICTSNDKTEQTRELLSFFGFVQPAQWNAHWKDVIVHYRQSKAFKAELESLSVWLRMGELEAQTVDCGEYNETTFRAVLNDIRDFTTKRPEEFQDRMKDLCAQAGVVYILVPELPKTRVSGATRWISDQKAILQQNLRYKTDDQFWFTFFHEAAHVLLHKSEKTILEFVGNSDTKEVEANRFAADFLIPPHLYAEFIKNKRFTKIRVFDFAREIGISPGIVVGRLQFDGLLRYDHLNALKKRFRWTSSGERQNQ